MTSQTLRSRTFDVGKDTDAMSTSPIPPNNKVDSEQSDSAQKTNTLESQQQVLVDDEDVARSGTCCFECCQPETRPGIAVARICACIFAGIIFGWALEKARVFEPASIRGQMVMKRWIMLKMFLGAMGTGQLIFGIMSLLPVTKRKFQAALDSFTPCFGDKGIFTATLGAFVLGSGMSLAGTCPGMILAQVGAWTKNSIFTLLGVLVGALVYGIVAPWMVKISKPKKPLQNHLVHETLNVPFAAIALPVAALIGTAVFLLEYYVRWEDDLQEPKVNDGVNNVMLYEAWPPSIAGVLVGLMQPVILYAVGDTLGGSTSYVTIMSQWVCTKKLKKTFPYLAKNRCGIGAWWQVFYVVAAMLGACLSAMSSDTLGTTKGPTIPTALCGGFLIIMGARFAAGCTSGHGLSGMAMLYWLSCIAVPSMFAGGIATAFAMQATGALDDYVCYDTTPTHLCNVT